MFQSDAVKSQWDTWAYYANDTFYAYYLITEHSPGEGFGVAKSADGATGWHDYGYVWHHDQNNSASFEGWEGTGAVWRSPDFNRTKKYIVNFSQCPRNGLQNISFAETSSS